MHFRHTKVMLSVAFFLCALGASAQIVVSATKQSAADGTLISNAQICFAPTDGTNPLSFRLPGNGQTVTTPVCGPVTGGGFSVVLPDTSKTMPLHPCFTVTITDNIDQDAAPLLGPGYTCVQPSSGPEATSGPSPWCTTTTGGITTCDFDNYPPNLPSLAPISLSGGVTNNYAGSGSAGDVIVANYPGNTLQAQLVAAEAANPGTATFLISQPGTIGGSTLMPGHHLIVQGVPVTFSTYLTPTQDNSLDCIGNAVLTMGVPYETPSAPDNTTPWFYSPYPASGTETERFAIRNCTFSGYGSLGAVFDSAGPTQDVTLDNDTTSYAWLYQQDSAGASNPTLRLMVTNSRCNWPTNIGNGACVESYGASEDFIITGNYWSGYYGVEMYANASDGTGAPSFPTLAQIQSSGLANGIISNNVCGPNITACQWTSVADHITMTGNSADECYDVCFDVEGGAHHLFTGNHCYATGNGCVTSFFTSYQNTAAVNQFDGCTNFHIFNASGQPSYVQDWTVGPGNVFNCPTASIWIYLDASQRTHFIQDKVTNGSYVFSGGQSDLRFDDSYFLWSIPVVSQAASGGGASPEVGGAGLGLPNPADTLGAFAVGNTIETTVSQTLPCLNGATSNYNVNVTTTMTGNKCLGPWSSPVLVFNNSSNNPSVGNTLILRDNGFSATGYSFAGTGDSPAPTVQSFGNYNSVTGAAMQ